MRDSVVYMDNHATTPVDGRVLRSMLPYFKETFGNAASRSHVFGQAAARAVQTARRQVAALMGAQPHEVLFTSGATESNNLAIKGAAFAYRDNGNHLVTVATEHRSVLDCFRRLGLEGFRWTCLSVGKDGLVDLEELKKAITRRTILVSVMMANNEIGVIQPIREIGRLAREKGVLFHCDAAQAVGKIPVDVNELEVDLLSFSAHKIYGPKGVGGLYVRKGKRQVRLIPILDGGGHEAGLRSGTLNVPGIVGLGSACTLCSAEMKKESKRLERLRNRLRSGLLAGCKGSFVVGSQERRLPNNLNIVFPGILAGELMERLKSVAFSAGSACLSSSPEPSYVLKALGLNEGARRSSVRFGLGRFNTEQEVDFVIKKVVGAVHRLMVK